MKFSKMFFHTFRELPSDATTRSHQLMLKAGYIAQLGAGIYSYMPLAHRVMTRIENILRDEMEKIDGQEIKMPVVNPGSVWKQTGRFDSVGREMARFTDRNNQDMVLAMTHEEVVGNLTAKFIRSYKQLPQLVYHIQTKFRDDPRPRAGLIRVREFTMKDSYSLDKDQAGLDQQYRAHYQAYFNIFNRCDLQTVSVKADTGMMGGQISHEYMYLNPIGEDTIMICPECGYKANRQVAHFRKQQFDFGEMKPLEEVYTPDLKTIEELADFLKVEKHQTAKAVFFMAEMQDDSEKLVFSIIRGDLDVNETKLTNLVKAKELRPATDEEIKAIGAVPGFASAIGIKGALVVVDDTVAYSTNLVSGANKKDYHYKNVNYNRDYSADIVGDISLAEEGFTCEQCDAGLKAERGIEVGNIFQLGTRYSEAFNAVYSNKQGGREFVHMGSYGIGVGRLFASVVEEHNDEYGMILPISIAPYDIHIVSMKGVDEEAAEIYQRLTEAGFDVLWDDRNESPGVKFNDADLIGIPMRLTVGSRGLKNDEVELKLRHEQEKKHIPLANLEEELDAVRQQLYDEINSRVVEVPYEE